MLFGHQNDDTKNDAVVSDNASQDAQATVRNDVTLTNPVTSIDLPAVPEDLEDDPSTVPAVDQTTDTPTRSDSPTPSDVLVPSAADDLLQLKQQALAQLSPLVGHLEQSPEEKFRTTMMLIQSSDNQALIKEAYAAAQQISDDKARAQALLDIVNEINYFTQQAQNS